LPLLQHVVDEIEQSASHCDLAGMAAMAKGNREEDPLFADAESGDFRLKPGSPCIDAGGPLTRTPSGGSGTVVEVEDALFLCDGYGIVEPDAIRVGDAQVRIVRVDYEKDLIEVAESVSFDVGAPVSLDHVGSAPDVGAFEYGADTGGEAQ
jgi:hypothetical protein